MVRFSIDNRFTNVSLIQFKRTAQKLESDLRKVRPTIQSELLLTTSREDYNGYGSLTVDTPEVEEALARREKFQLSDLNEELWRRAFKIQMGIIDDSAKKPYCVFISVEDREPKRLFFYGQCLDGKSQKVFEGFKGVGGLQRLGDGFPKTSEFASGYSSRNKSFK